MPENAGTVQNSKTRGLRMLRQLVLVMFIAAAQGAANARAFTWLTPAPIDATAPGPSGEAPTDAYFYSEPAAPLELVDLTEAYTPRPDHPDQTIAAGTRLFRVDDEGGDVFFCSTQRLRDFNASDMPRAILFGAFGMARSVVGREAGWQCFHDRDADGRFDVVAGGSPGLASRFQFVETITARAPIESPVTYQVVTPDAYPYEIGLKFFRLRRLREGAQYVVYFCLGTSGPTPGACSVDGVLLGGARHPFPVAIDAFAGRVLVDGVNEADPEHPTVIFRVERRFQNNQRFRVLTEERRTPGGVIEPGDTHFILPRN